MNAKAMNRRIGWAIVAIAVALPVVVPHARPAPGGVSCGLGLPPGAPGFAEAQAQQALEAKTNGYLKVCEANLERYRIAFRPSAPIMADLSFQPVNLSGTQFANFKSLGAMIAPDNTPHTRLYRGFLMPDGHNVTLFEQDMSVDGTRSWRAPEDEPERINGMPARLSVFQAPSGNAISHLSWVERRRAYELWIDANVVDTPLRQQLFALAASLPPSVPACPNEVPPKPARIGADGFPADEPMLITLTQAEIDGMSDRSKRPCK